MALFGLNVDFLIDNKGLSMCFLLKAGVLRYYDVHMFYIDMVCDVCYGDTSKESLESLRIFIPYLGV